MNFNITYSLIGPCGRVDDIPNHINPVEAVSMQDALFRISQGFPIKIFGQELECVKITVEKVPPVTEALTDEQIATVEKERGTEKVSE